MFTTDTNNPRFIPITVWAQYYPDPSPSALRWMVFSNQDFTNRCVLRRGRRVLIDTHEYERWMLETNGKQVTSDGGNSEKY